MAEKRMFTMRIVDSDAFLDMPLSAQALYFHLNMRADDDGFINNPKKIQRMIGASEDDLKLLIAKRFVLAFQSGVIVIKHWRMHNLIRKDRYNPTQYQDEFKMLDLKENGAYTEHDGGAATTWQPPGNQVAPQVSIGKISIDKYSGEEGYINNIQGQQNNPPPAPPIEPLQVAYQTDLDEIIATWNTQSCTHKIDRIPFGGRRYSNTMICINNNLPNFLLTIKDLDNQAWFADRAKRNDPLKYDWFVDPNNYIKVTEGNYRDLRQAEHKETDQERALRMIEEATE